MESKVDKSHWVVVCGPDQVEVLIEDELFDQIPLFKVLSASGMKETYTKLIKKPDITHDILQKVIDLVSIRFEKCDVRAFLRSFITSELAKSSETAVIMPELIQNLIETHFKPLSFSMKVCAVNSMVILMRVKQINSILPPVDSEGMFQFKAALDQLLLSDKMEWVESIERYASSGDKKINPDNFSFTDLYTDLDLIPVFSTCSHFFANPRGCKYGDKCSYAHTCDPELHDQVVENCKRYLIDKRNKFDSRPGANCYNERWYKRNKNNDY
jgi:hypothetical protein